MGKPTTMTAKQARRLALWINGQYLKSADHTGFADDMLDEQQSHAILVAKDAIAEDLLQKSGIPIDFTQGEAIEWVLAGLKT